jgi:hypothetical protein
MYDAMGVRVGVPFDPYIGLVNFLVTSNMFPHITMVILLLVYHCADEAVTPHQGHTVADFTHQIYDWRNRMSRCGAKDRGSGSWTGGRAQRSTPSATSLAPARTRSGSAYTHGKERGRRKLGANTTFYSYSLTT